MSRSGFFLLAAPVVLAMLTTPATGAAQSFVGRSNGGLSYGGGAYGRSHDYGRGYGYRPGYSGFSISFGRGYASPGYLSNSYYAPRYEDSDWGYSSPYSP